MPHFAHCAGPEVRLNPLSGARMVRATYIGQSLQSRSATIISTERRQMAEARAIHSALATLPPVVHQNKSRAVSETDGAASWLCPLSRHTACIRLLHRLEPDPRGSAQVSIHQTSARSRHDTSNSARVELRSDLRLLK